MKIKNVWICRIENDSINPVFGEIIVEKGKISGINEIDPASLKFKNNSEKNAIDGGGRVVTIPSINFHDHFYSRLAKGLLLKGPMDNFYNILKNLWWKLDLVLDKEMVRASAQMAAMESIRNGVTYIFDHHSSPNAAGSSLENISEIIKDCNLRGVLCFEITDRNGDLSANDGLKETENFLNAHLNDNDIKSLIGLHASFTLSDSTLLKAREIQQKFNCGIHIHLCEDKTDAELTLENFNKLPTERIAAFGLLNDKSILGHGIHLSKNDYDIILEKGSALAFNPDSNMNNQVGLPKFQNIPEGIPALCGTDGMHSNPLKSLKQLFLLGRHYGMSFETAFNWIRKIYFDQLKFITKYFPDFPFLQNGDRADFIIWDYIPPTPFIQENFWGHFIYGIIERPVYSVVQNGQILMDNYLLVKDFGNYNLNIKEQGEKLFKILHKN